MYVLATSYIHRATAIKKYCPHIKMTLIYRAYDSSYISQPMSYQETQRARDACIKADGALVDVRVEHASNWKNLNPV